MDPEGAHRLALQSMSLAADVAPLRGWIHRRFASEPSPVRAFGLTFRNPVGLAAGYDKDGVAWRGLACLGFGHVEIGTVTPELQPGNPKPRVFRLERERSLINRLGFPSRGAEFVARRLAGPRPEGLVLGVNVGKQKATPLDRAAEDYERLIDRFAPLADYLAVNVSSPNTPELRTLQQASWLGPLLSRVTTRRDAQSRRVPVLVKLSPDMEVEQLEEAAEILVSSGVDGVIATNTTLSREGVADPRAAEAGGLSGAALTERATAVLARLVDLTRGRLPIVASGGVLGVEDAKAKLDAGAVLVQVYTGMIYEGPGLVRQLVDGLRSSART